MQIRQRFSQGPPQGGRRKPPAGMPTSLPRQKPVLGDSRPPDDRLPRQMPVTDEPAPVKPAKWKKILKRILTIIGIVLALSMAYVFLLMGEPDEDDQLAAQSTAQEETIRVPIAASEAGANVDLNLLAASFGKPVLTFYGTGVTLQKATLFDTAYQSGYARRVTLEYAFPDGKTFTLESIRPTGAITLLNGSGYSINVEKLYSLAGMNAVRMDSSARIRLVARGTAAAYAVLCPADHLGDLATLIKQTTLVQAAGQ